jgi:hypothetical protein
MRSVPILVMAFAIAACQSAGTRSPSMAESRLGVYEFTERVEGARSQLISLDGEFTVLPDTVTVQLMSASCLYNMQSNRTGPIMYDCGDIKLAFHRDDPIHRSTYSMRINVTEQRQVCVRYDVDAQGRRRCAEMRMEVVDRVVTRTGRLNPRRTD